VQKALQSLAFIFALPHGPFCMGNSEIQPHPPPIAENCIYRTAIQLGVSDGMARAFKEDLKLFKPAWREAKTLLELSR